MKKNPNPYDDRLTIHFKNGQKTPVPYWAESYLIEVLQDGKDLPGITTFNKRNEDGKVIDIFTVAWNEVVFIQR